MLRYTIPLIGLVLVLAAPAAARNEPDGRITNLYDLARDEGKPLTLVHRTGAGVWQYGDDRVLGRIERDVTYSTAFKYIHDARSTGWHSQAFLAVRDLRGVSVPEQVERAKHPGAGWFGDYLSRLGGLYRKGGFAVVVEPGPVRFQKHIRAGRKKVRVYFADLGIRWKPKEGRAEEYHVNVFGFVVDDWLVTLRVHFANDDRTSAFLDGLALTIKRKLPKGTGNVKLTSVTPENLETRIGFTAPKGFRRLNPGPVHQTPRGSLIRFLRHDKRGDWNASMALERHYSKFDAARDLAAWKRRHRALLGDEPDVRDRKVADLDVHYAMADAKRDGQDVTVCLLFFKVGVHRYTIRCEHAGVGKKVRAQAIKECNRMLATLRGWQTIPQRS